MAVKGKHVGLFIAILLPVIFLIIFMPKEEQPKIYMPLRHFPVGLDTTINEDGETEIDTLYYKIPDWQLATHLGDTLHSDQLANQLYVVDFFFTSCPGQCPLMSSQMERVQKELVSDDQIRFISISIDPERDSIPKLRDYAKEYNVIPGKWWLLTGEKDYIYSLAKETFKISAKDTENKDEGEDGFIHSDRFILVDQDKHIRGYYHGTDTLEVNNLIGDAVLLLKALR